MMLASTFQDYITQIIGGIGAGSVLFLVASGLTLIFGALRVINFAHGGLYLLGGYITYEIQNALGFSNAIFWVVILLASLAVALCGLGLEVGFFRPIYRRTVLTQLIVAFGFAFIITGLIRNEIGGGGTTTKGPPPFLQGHVNFGVQTVTYIKFFYMGMAIVVGIGLWALLYRTDVGRMIRAAVSDPELLALSGVNVRMLFTGVFVMASLLAGFAGAVSSFEGSVSPTDGDIIIRAFIVVVIGGLGSISGALIASMLVGIFEALGTLWVPPANIAIVYAVLVLVLVVRPQGLRGVTA
jgi:branched-subunit amino acid ABC-type transport system permease component